VLCEKHSCFSFSGKSSNTKNKKDMRIATSEKRKKLNLDIKLNDDLECDIIPILKRFVKNVTFTSIDVDSFRSKRISGVLEIFNVKFLRMLSVRVNSDFEAHFVSAVVKTCPSLDSVTLFGHSYVSQSTDLITMCRDIVENRNLVNCNISGSIFGDVTILGNKKRWEMIEYMFLEMTVIPCFFFEETEYGGSSRKTAFGRILDDIFCAFNEIIEIIEMPNPIAFIDCIPSSSDYGATIFRPCGSAYKFPDEQDEYGFDTNEMDVAYGLPFFMHTRRVTIGFMLCVKDFVHGTLPERFETRIEKKDWFRIDDDM
jgi:hypothetical protein